MGHGNDSAAAGVVEAVAPRPADYCAAPIGGTQPDRDRPYQGPAQNCALLDHCALTEGYLKELSWRSAPFSAPPQPSLLA